MLNSIWCVIPLVFGSIAAGQSELPTVTITRDDTRLTESCRVVIPEGTLIADTNGNGVIQIVGDGITVEFARGSELIGMVGLAGWETDGVAAYHLLKGTGITAQGVSGVTIRGARIRGYRVGIDARSTPGLVLEDVEVTDVFQMPLRSTPSVEDKSDWLSAHNNDNGEWLERYGAAVAVKDSEGVTIRRVRVRRAQNGIVLDRVNNSRVYDNDCSYLSGWGIAMWRSSENTVSRNAVDYCVRGHSEGVYNRGQDSAGILMFEQCRSNKILENSATHCGDGIFAFAGIEAIGQSAEPEGGIDYLDSGDNENVFLGNRLSYSSAHGLELTFSENNIVAGNTFIGNAICGIWGGYSSGTRVHGNTFADNGGMPYGFERGGINAEHASGWLIDSNTFTNDRAAIHFWTDNDASLLKLPGVRLGYRGVDGNVITRNRIVINRERVFPEGETLYGLHTRRVISNETDRVRPFGTNWLMENTFEIEDGVGEALLSDQAEFLTPSGAADDLVWFGQIPSPEVFGETRPTMKVLPAGGRDSIVMGPWRAWDFESPMLREASRLPGVRRYELFVPTGWSQEVRVEALAGPEARLSRVEGATELDPFVISVESAADEVVAAAGFRVSVGNGVDAAEYSKTVVVPLMRVNWAVKAWAWKNDPIQDRAAWRSEADSVEAVSLAELELPFGNGGPADALEELKVKETDRFGIVAQTQIVLPAGRWRLATVSDDGIRVKINGKAVIDRWDIHGPTPDGAGFVSDGVNEVSIEVEYFENDGFAQLRVELMPG